MGEYARKRRQIYEVARPKVTDLVEETGELANLLVEEHGRGVYLYRARGEKAVTLDTIPASGGISTIPRSGRRSSPTSPTTGFARSSIATVSRRRRRTPSPTASDSTKSSPRPANAASHTAARSASGGSSASQRRSSAGRRGAGGDQRGRPDYPAGGRTLRRGGPRTRAPGCERRGDQRHVQLIDVSPPVRLTTPHIDSNGTEGSAAVPLGGNANDDRRIDARQDEIGHESTPIDSSSLSTERRPVGSMRR